jgi:[ribosomal protein S5]-alanine N-acetyltransferase
MSSPTIRTGRLLLRPFVASDAADVFAYASNPNVARYTTWSPHRTVADSEAFLAWLGTLPADDYTWAICLLEDPRAQGAVEFALSGPDSAELHYVLAEPLWNRGFMTEAVHAALRWGLDHHPAIAHVVSRAVVENAASLRVMEKCGLRFRCECEATWAKEARPVRQHEYAARREDVLARLP